MAQRQARTPTSDMMLVLGESALGRQLGLAFLQKPAVRFQLGRTASLENRLRAGRARTKRTIAEPFTK